MPSPPTSTDDTSTKGKLFLIAAGIARYDHVGPLEQLPSVTADVKRIVDLFTNRLGYERILPGLGDNPTSDEVRRKLGDWLNDPWRSASDRIVLYYAGHGVFAKDNHYLLTADSKTSNLEGTAIAVASLARMLHGTPIQQILVILDTCHAGRGLEDFGEVAQGHISSLRTNDKFARGFYAIAAARPPEEAVEGFAQALVEALENPPLGCGGDQQEYLAAYELLIQAINEKLETRGLKQRARLDSLNVQSEALFFRNLRYRTVPAGLDLQSQRAWIRFNSPDVVAHFGPRSRGVEIESQTGWYFTGRTVVLTELVTWQTSPAHDGKARVITAGPGSGKSAVLARIVTLSDPEYRRRVPLDGVPPESIPPERLVDVAIHARQKTLKECLDEIASSTGVPATSPELLVDILAREGRTRVIVLDALDQAVEPYEIARKLLRPLTSVRSVRLLVGTRRETLEGLRGDLLAALGPAVVTLDLDDPKYVQPADLAEYVRRRLLARDDPTRPSPYRDRPELVSQVADPVGAKAYPVFLIARLISQSLLEAAGPVDVTRPDWKAFPTTVADAFDEYLDRFGANKERVVDLFRPWPTPKGLGSPSRTSGHRWLQPFQERPTTLGTWNGGWNTPGRSWSNQPKTIDPSIGCTTRP